MTNMQWYRENLTADMLADIFEVFQQNCNYCPLPNDCGDGFRSCREAIKAWAGMEVRVSIDDEDIHDD